MKDLIEKVMKFNVYPDQNPPWSGWEYVPETEEELRRFCEVIGYSWWEGMDWACLQMESHERFVVAVDSHVWDVSEVEFKRILESLIK